jgi:hypothetical protein
VTAPDERRPRGASFRTRWLAALACAAVHVAAAGSSPIDGNVIRVPSETCKGFWFIPISLRGREGSPDDRTLWFVYDTGASHTYVDPQSLDRVTGDAFDDRSKIRLVEARSGPLRIRRLPARVKDLDHLSIALGREIDGILAFRVFYDYLATLDYTNGEIRLTRGELPAPDGRTVFSAAGPDDRPWIRVDIDGRRERLLIDSGAGGASIKTRKLARFRTVAPPRLTHASAGIRSVTRHRTARLAGEVRIGTTVLPGPIVHETDDTRLLGGAVMRHFLWTFDQRNERVRAEPVVPDEPIMMPGYVGHGIAAVGRNGHLEVYAVLPETPAERAGLLPGDVITHFGETPVASRGCGNSAAGEALEIRFLRDGRLESVTLELAVLVE